MKKELKSEQITFRTTKEIKEFVDNLAAEHDRSVAYVITDLLGYFIDNPPKALPFRRKK